VPLVNNALTSTMSSHKCLCGIMSYYTFQKIDDLHAYIKGVLAAIVNLFDVAFVVSVACKKDLC
jgi:hypothetical protein